MQNYNKLKTKLNKISNEIVDKNIETAVRRGALVVQGASKRLCVTKESGGGNLKNSIKIKSKRTLEGAQGIVYTNASYASYVEFGTGKKGAENNKGISPNVNVSYTMSPWWIHEPDISAEDAETYKMFHIDTPSGRFYRSSGQAAKPFLYPAIKDNSDVANRAIAKHIANKLKKEMIK